MHGHVAKVRTGGRGSKEHISSQIAYSIHKTIHSVAIEARIILQRIGRDIVVDILAVDNLVSDSLEALSIGIVDSLRRSKLVLQSKQMHLLHGLRRSPVDCVMAEGTLKEVRKLNVKISGLKCAAEKESLAKNVQVGLARTISPVQASRVTDSVAALSVFSARKAQTTGRIRQTTSTLALIASVSYARITKNPWMFKSVREGKKDNLFFLAHRKRKCRKQSF